MIEEKKQEVKKVHEQWMKHPMTGMILNMLDTFKGRLVFHAATGANDESLSDAQVRQRLSSVRNTEALIELMKNSDKLLTELEKQETTT